MTIRRTRFSPYLFLTLAALCWASGWIIGRGLKSEIPPMAMAFFRWLFAAAILAPFAWRHLRRDFPKLRKAWPLLIPLGVLGCGYHNALTYLGLHFTTATNGVLLNSFTPVLIVALSRLVLKERLAPLQLAGLGVSLCGMLVILSRGSLAELAQLRFNAGDLLVLAALAMWATYTICIRWRPPGVHDLAFLLALMFIGVAGLVPPWIAEQALGYAVQWNALTLAALLALALFSSVLPYLFWHEGVARVGANVAGLFSHLTPVFGVLLAWLILGEELHLFHIAGFALILTGIYVTSRFRHAPAGAEG